MKKIALCLIAFLIIAAGVFIGVKSNLTYGKNIPAEKRNVLVVYFTRSGTTEFAARDIANAANGDLVKVSRVTPYPVDLEDCVAEAAREMQADELPEINKLNINMDRYNVVFLCYPIWLNSIPMPMVSFMEQYDLSGKYIIPVATHSGSQLGNSIYVINSHCKDSTVLDGISLTDGNKDLLKKLEEYGF